MRSVTFVAISLLAVMCVNTHVLAQSAAPPTQRKVWTEWLDREQPQPEVQPEPEETWYGWQTLLVDALFISAAALTATVDFDGWFWLSMGMVTIGSPVVHFAQLNLTQGIASLGMRLVSGSLFVLAVDSSDERDGIGIGFLGVVATATVVVLDATLFAWRDHPRKTRARAWLTPWVDPQRGHLGLAYAADF